MADIHNNKEEEEEEEDPWGAFGDDDSDEGRCEGNNSNVENGVQQAGIATASAVALFLVQHFLKRHTSTSHRLLLDTIRVQVTCFEHSSDGNINDDNNNNNNNNGSSLLQSWETILHDKGFAVVVNSSNDSNSLTSSGYQLFDAVIVWDSQNSLAEPTSKPFASETLSSVSSRVVSGGILILPKFLFEENSSVWDINLWQTHKLDTIVPNDTVALHKWACPIQCEPTNCPWLPHKPHLLVQERERLQQVTVGSTAVEREKGVLSPASIDKAVHQLTEYGYCVIPQLLNPGACEQWGQVVLADLHEAASILLQNDDVDLFHPQLSKSDPATYRELSMREDLRMDLRHGPRLDQVRGGPQGCRPLTITAKDRLASAGDEKHLLFRGHEQLLEIVRRVMNPKDEWLAKGNFGRYNFSGSGPDGSFQDLRVGPVGGIISLPGSADQAIHADTPHLFEHMDALPAHYVNAFTPGCRAHPRVGQTAFVHASHRLQFCAQHMTGSNGEGGTKDGWKSFVVRPMLDLGDVLLFDCRILHFGMANTSTDIERPLIYTNMTQHWFHDPKNWDNQRRIFVQQEGKNLECWG